MSGNLCAMFAIATAPSESGVHIRYAEYSTIVPSDEVGHSNKNATNHQCSNLLEMARQAPAKEVWMNTHGLIYVRSLSCTHSGMSAKSLTFALRAFRSIQLENPVYVPQVNWTSTTFEPPTVDDLLRAALAIKTSDHAGQPGTAWRYAECGVYDGRFAAPFVISLSGVVALSLVAAFC